MAGDDDEEDPDKEQAGGDPFLTHAAGRVDNPATQRKKVKRWGWIVDALTGGALMIVPWLNFALISILFVFPYHRWAAYVWLVVCFCLLGSVLFILQTSAGSAEHAHAGGGGTTAFFMGALCFVATVSAAALGYYNYHTNMFPYWSLSSEGEYINLMPTDPAVAHADAGKVVFTDLTRVDSTRAVGYKDGTTYCVAPIMDDSPMTKVEYWAVGEDCCPGRADFNCDDAWDPKARSGVVIMDVNATFMPRVRPYYKEAVKIAEATYDIASAKEPLFVRWVADPEIIQDDYWRKGVGDLVAFLSIYLLLSFIFGSVGVSAVKRAAY